MKNDDATDLNQERLLQEKLSSLPVAEDPANNLWPRIEAEIFAKSKAINSHLKTDTNYYTPKWISWAIAASLVVSIGSLSFSWQNLQEAKTLYSRIEQSAPQQEKPIENGYLLVAQHIANIEEAYQVARNKLLSDINAEDSSIEREVIERIIHSLVDVDNATLLLKAAIKREPSNSELPRLLRATYEQELAVLTRLAKLDKSI